MQQLQLQQQSEQQEVSTEIELQTEEVAAGEGEEITFMVQVDKDGKQELVQLTKDQARKQLEEGKNIKHRTSANINLYITDA